VVVVVASMVVDLELGQVEVAAQILPMY